MAHYRNDSSGLRGVLIAGGSYLWIEPGETKEIPAGKIKSLPGGVYEVDPLETDKPIPPKAKGADPFDHDGDDKAGGSTKPTDDPAMLKALRKEYKAVIGKAPFPGWGIDELKKRMAAA